MYNSKITGLGYYVPENVVTNDDLKDKDESRTRHRQLLSTSQHTKKANKKSSASPTDILKRWIRRPSLHHRQNNWASKKLQGQLNMVVHENDGFERWWPLFRSNEIESSKPDPIIKNFFEKAKRFWKNS